VPDAQTTAQRRSPRAIPVSKATFFANRSTLAVVCGFIALAMVLWLSALGSLQGWWLLAVVGLAALALPTSEYLSWRIVITGCLFYGSVSMLYWMRLPEGFLGWGHLMLGAVISGLTVRVVASKNRKQALASLLPRVTKADFLIAVAAVLGAAALMPYFVVSSGPRALSVLMSTWDNSSHFNMYFMLRSHGTVIPMTGIPGAGFMEYPEGFHAALATMADLVLGSPAAPLANELVAYSRLSALVSVISVVMVTAGLTSLPWIRRRPLVSAPVVVFVATAWSFGTASHANFYAFQNFLLGVALLVCLAVLCTFADVLARPVIFAAAGAAVVGVANAWSLLLVLVAPVLVLAVFPLIRDRWRTTPIGWVLNLTSAALACTGLALVWLQISRIGSGDVVTAVGRVRSSTHGVEIATLLVALAASTLLVHGSASQFLTGRGMRHSSARLVIVPVLGLILILAFGTYQVLSTGSVTYYSLKLALAVELLLPVVACISLTALADRWLATHLYVHPRGLGAISVLTALASTQIFGLTVADPKPLGMEPVAPYQQGMATVATQTSTNATAAKDLLLAAEAHKAGQGDSIYITNSDKVGPILAATWYMSLTGTYNRHTSAGAGQLKRLNSGYSDNLKETVETILNSDPGLSVVMDKSLRDFLINEGLPESMLARVRP
jgi:hypothetical protein